MEYIILIAIVAATSSIISKIEKLDKKINKSTTSKVDLKKLIGKKVKIELATECSELDGILVSSDENWIELQRTVETKKGKITETHFDRIENIQTITLEK